MALFYRRRGCEIHKERALIVKRSKTVRLRLQTAMCKGSTVRRKYNWTAALWQPKYYVVWSRWHPMKALVEEVNPRHGIKANETQSDDVER
jgi:REP element-mobilizing transposase RayT